MVALNTKIIAYYLPQYHEVRHFIICSGPENCPRSLFDVPQALKRKPHRKWIRKNKRMKGRSIDKRPDIVNAGTEIGHWEVDTVVGHRKGHEAVVFTAVVRR